ncbi:MAG: tetratricopeptide repeat protein [bacterium]|nr:tetratricopeptide repeat protein [bacterium]
MSENQQALEQAYMLIEAQKLGEARAILEKVLAQDKNSADVWWLYAHAIDDPKQAVTALENVVRLDSTNAEAKTLLQTARQQAGIGVGDDDFDFDDEDLAPAEEDEPDDTRRRSFIIFGVIVALVALGLFILIASPRGDTNQPATSPTGTFVSQNADSSALTSTAQVAIANQTTIPLQPIDNDSANLTLTAQSSLVTPDSVGTEGLATSVIVSPTETVAVITEDVVTEIVATPSIENFLASLATDYPTNGTTELVDSVFGATLLVPMCTARGEDHSGLIPRAMAGLSQNIALLPVDYMAVGVRFLDCTANETINVMIMPTQSALEYNNADLSEQDFRRSWSVIDA